MKKKQELFEVVIESVEGVMMFVVRMKTNRSFNDGVVSYNFINVEQAVSCKNRLEKEFEQMA
jgi:hypothetical protein